MELPMDFNVFEVSLRRSNAFSLQNVDAPLMLQAHFIPDCHVSRSSGSPKSFPAFEAIWVYFCVISFKQCRSKVIRRPLMRFSLQVFSMTNFVWYLFLSPFFLYTSLIIYLSFFFFMCSPSAMRTYHEGMHDIFHDSSEIMSNLSN